MGMYTELAFAADFKGDTPQEVVAMIRYLAKPDSDLVELPAHELFLCDRWRMLLTCDSAYFPGPPFASFEEAPWGKQMQLSTRFNMKNYDSEIEKFLDWVYPHLDQHDGDYLGTYRYEEDDLPTILTYGRSRIDWSVVTKIEAIETTETKEDKNA